MHTIGVAKSSDHKEIETLDALSFPQDDIHREPAVPGELSAGIKSGQILVARIEGRIVGFLHYEKPLDDHIYISALAVHPDYRSRGIASTLLDHFLKISSKTTGNPGISTVTSPTNIPMLRILTSRGFLVRTVMKDYFGPGRDRFYCQYRSRLDFVHPDDRFIVPANALPHLYLIMEATEYAITSVTRLPSGPAFEVCRFEREDISSLQADEVAVGVQFSSGILAAITFILGFSLTSSSYGDDVRVVLIGAVISTIFSLTVYANASGELARIRTNNFHQHMKLGNILSEHGGVLPFLIILPVIFAGVSDNKTVSWVITLVAMIAIIIYDRSRFSISYRFRRGWLVNILAAIIYLSPLSGTLLIHLRIPTWTWTTVISLALISQACVYAFMRDLEGADTRLTAAKMVRR